MEGNECSYEGCEFDVYEENNECVLHCEKNHEYNYREPKIYEGFKEALIKHIAIQLVSERTEESYIDKETVIFILEGNEDISSNRIQNNDVITGSLINLSWINFPFFQSNEYIKVLNILDSIEFDFCHFDLHKLELRGTKCFFQDCTFHNDWMLTNTSLLAYDSNLYKVIYRKCDFLKDVHTSVGINEQYIIDETPFSQCKITKLLITHTFFKKMIFNDLLEFEEMENKKEIKNIQISHSKIGREFKLNNYEFNSFKCKHTVFKSNFTFNQNNIESFEIDKVTFKGLVNFNNTEFESFQIEKSIFEKFTNFEKCEFGKKNNHYPIAEFKNTTFLDFINFREAKFYSGLDLENANLKEYPNFLYCHIETQYTNRETFRIIKHSFDKVGNTIEANKYFAYEMEKERENISIKKDVNKRVMLNLNYWISNFGQSWIRPLIWILGIVLLHYFIVKGTFQCISPSNFIYEPLKLLGNFFDDLANSIIPFRRFLKSDKEGMEFINLIFLIMYSTLIYNLVIAVKRITKR